MKPAQARLAAVLDHLKIDRVTPLNRGMTSALYDIGDGRVLKIHNGPLEPGYLPSLRRLCHRLQRHSLPFAVPLIHEHGAVGRHLTITLSAVCQARTSAASFPVSQPRYGKSH